MALALGCAAPLAPRRETAACTPAFPYRDGWLGGDAAYSVPLDAERTLWLFGDTFVDRDALGAGASGPPPERRDPDGLVFGNTIGISTCAPDGRFEIRYHLRPAAARPFFDPPWRTAGRFFWPLDGFVHEGVLYVGLLEASSDWRFHGTALARVDNPEAPPSQWRVGYSRLSDHDAVFPGFAMLARKGRLYLLASLVREGEPRRRILTRLSLDALARRSRAGESLEGALETLGQSGAWRPGLDPAGARILMDDSATEMSVRFHPRLGRFVAVYIELSELPPREIVYRTAPALSGPWSAPAPLFAIPEAAPGSAVDHAELVCYGGKEHAAFRAAARLAISYVCSSFDGARLLRDLRLYRPLVVRRPLPE